MRVLKLNGCSPAELPFIDNNVCTTYSHQSPLRDRGLFDRRVNGISVSHLNISVLPKHDELQLMLEKGGSLVFGLSETWLDDRITDLEVGIPSFKVFRRDRNRRGGRVMVYVSEQLKAVRRKDLEVNAVEAVWVEVKTRNGILLICNVYRPPDAREVWMQDFAVMMEKAAHGRTDRIVLGDLTVMY